MKIITTIPCIGLLLFVFGCQKDGYRPEQNNEKKYDISSFDRIETADGFDVTVQQGAAFSVIASGKVADLDNLSITKKESTLTLAYASQRKNKETVVILIMMPVIKGFNLSGAANVRTFGFTAEIDRFDVALSGASIGQFNINASEIHVQLNGACEAHFKGRGNKVDATVTGASQLYAEDYPVDKAELVVSGASAASVNVISLLRVKASDASEVVNVGKQLVDPDQQD